MRPDATDNAHEARLRLSPLYRRSYARLLRDDDSLAASVVTLHSSDADGMEEAILLFFKLARYAGTPVVACSSDDAGSSGEDGGWRELGGVRDAVEVFGDVRKVHVGMVDGNHALVASLSFRLVGDVLASWKEFTHYKVRFKTHRKGLSLDCVYGCMLTLSFAGRDGMVTLEGDRSRSLADLSGVGCVESYSPIVKTYQTLARDAYSWDGGNRVHGASVLDLMSDLAMFLPAAMWSGRYLRSLDEPFSELALELDHLYSSGGRCWLDEEREHGRWHDEARWLDIDVLSASETESTLALHGFELGERGNPQGNWQWMKSNVDNVENMAWIVQKFGERPDGDIEIDAYNVSHRAWIMSGKAVDIPPQLVEKELFGYGKNVHNFADQLRALYGVWEARPRLGVVSDANEALEGMRLGLVGAASHTEGLGMGSIAEAVLGGVPISDIFA